MTPTEAIDVIEQMRQAFQSSGKDGDIIRQAVLVVRTALAPIPKAATSTTTPAPAKASKPKVAKARKRRSKPAAPKR